MKSNTFSGTFGLDDELERNAETLRDDIETYFFNLKHGKKGVSVVKITDQDLAENEDDHRMGSDEDEDLKDAIIRSLQTYDDEKKKDDDPAYGGRTMSSWDDDADEDEEKTDAFAGHGHTLGKMKVNPKFSNTSTRRAFRHDYHRTINKTSFRSNNGTGVQRISFTDDYASPLTAKRVVKKGMSDLDVGSMEIADEEVKAPKRNSEDSPRASRAAIREQVGVNDLADNPTNMLRSLFRDRESRTESTTSTNRSWGRL